MIGLARSSLQYHPDPKDDNAVSGNCVSNMMVLLESASAPVVDTGFDSADLLNDFIEVRGFAVDHPG